MGLLVNDIRINDEQNLFAVSTDAGLRLFWVYPLRQLIKLNVEDIGTLKFCSLHATSNLLAMAALPLVSTGFEREPFFIVGGDHLAVELSLSIMKIWNQKSKKFIGMFNLTKPVRNVIMTDRLFIAIMDRQINIYSFPVGNTVYGRFITAYNPNGFGVISEEGHKQVFVFPGQKSGTVEIVNLQELSLDQSEHFNPSLISINSTEIAGLAMNKEGTLIAIGCHSGRIIKLFDVRARDLINDLWRGSDPAIFHCIRFSRCSSFLGVTSDKDTIHIFKISLDKFDQRRTSGVLQNIGLSNDSAIRSFAKFTLPSPTVVELIFPSSSRGDSNTKKDCGSLIAICSNGHYFRLEFNLDGSVKLVDFDLYFETGNEQSFFDINN
ncbi:unnamed protein product [Dracunculus medinensis]|uniref:WD_REPEATS_REGION domain-containing protein n=1 Tax=Dracunculus medinensis TaxID=318479 RepID=A0A0N4U9N6_DRAME|nr:unnamed protein product [Dracunculus medinensis]